ncbi:interferon gamma receptor 1-like [Dicentrarchus labrax]|uniref:Fibronectin type-III domain-containing protein n=1 Tax=Dicentrarchus labrax TaxID=13489 RepID=A0A8C4HTJ3_DICLA|nr:interferon gamma receptor 1-like [Dicentrarchus labrax]
MFSVKYHPVFLLLLCLRAVAAHVEPPANVTLVCHNLHNVLKWSYDQFVPGLAFKVAISSTSSAPDVLWVSPPSLQADVSISDIDYDYFLTVSAVIGQNESDPAPPDGITFSYFHGSLVGQKCSVDFPPVTVTAQQDGPVHYQFKHPWLLYSERLAKKSEQKKKSADKEFLPELQYDVGVFNQEEHSQRFSCEDSVCKGNLTGVSTPELCLKFSGEMAKVSVQATGESCALLVSPPPNDQKDYVYVIIGLLILAAFAFVVFMVYKKKTNASSSNFPSAMTITNTLKQIIVQEVEHVSPTPLLSNETVEKKEKEFPPSPISSTDCEGCQPFGVLTEADECDVVEVGTEEGPGYMPGSNLEEDDAQSVGELPSGYEKREVLVDLGLNEQAEGYRG